MQYTALTMQLRSTLQVLRSEPVAIQAYRALRHAILQGQFRPGQRLIETELAEILGVSRTPVREALSKLEVDGLVDLLPAGGVVVRDIEPELEEIYGLRQRVEGYAAHLAAERVTPAELAALEDVCQRALAAVDSHSLPQRAELNNSFHRLLTEASHSPRLIRLTNSYREYFLDQRMLQFYDRDTAVRHHEQHRRIIEALRQRDGAMAERLVTEHFQSALAIIRAALTSDRPRGRRSEEGA
jgi:DNA-binding GntR family transcriptional regulator